MSPRAKALQNLYRRGKIIIDGLQQAVRDNVITEEEFKLITGEDYEWQTIK